MEPNLLFKYREDSVWTEEILQNKKVWLSVADQLNDPLECRTGVIPEDWKRQTILQMETGQIMGVLGPPISKPPETLFSLSPRDTRRWLKKFKSASHEGRMKAMRDLYREHGIHLSRPDRIFERFQQQLSTVGIFSLTERSDNSLMWAHYAKAHTGLALGFSRAENNKLGNSKHTLKVTYDSVKPVFKTGFMHEITISTDRNGEQVSHSKLSFEDPVFRATFSTKPPEWSYEEEWRYIEETSGLHPWPGDFVSVVFGLRMPKERREHYRKLVTASGSDPIYYEIRVIADTALQLCELID